jgi:hypothetical protein
MVLTVLENAYLKKAEEIPNYNETHKKLLMCLINEKKYFQKNELLCFTNYCEQKLDKIIKDLEKTGLIQTEGWLIRAKQQQEIIQTLTIITTKK